MKTILKTCFESFKFYFKLNLRLIGILTIFFVMFFLSKLLVATNDLHLSILQNRLNSLHNEEVFNLLNNLNKSSFYLNSQYNLFYYFITVIFTALILWVILRMLKKRDLEIRSLFLIGKSHIQILSQLMLEIIINFIVSLFAAVVINIMLYPFFVSKASSLNSNLFLSNLDRIYNANSHIDVLKIIERFLSNNKISMYNSNNILVVKSDLIKLNLSEISIDLFFLITGILIVISIFLVVYLNKKFNRRLVLSSL